MIYNSDTYSTVLVTQLTFLWLWRCIQFTWNIYQVSTMHEYIRARCQQLSQHLLGLAGEFAVEWSNGSDDVVLTADNLQDHICVHVLISDGDDGRVAWDVCHQCHDGLRAVVEVVEGHEGYVEHSLRSGYHEQAWNLSLHYITSSKLHSTPSISSITHSSFRS